MIEAELPFLLLGPVALEAVRGENRADLLFEKVDASRVRGSVSGSENAQDEGKTDQGGLSFPAPIVCEGPGEIHGSGGDRAG